MIHGRADRHLVSDEPVVSSLERIDCLRTQVPIAGRGDRYGKGRHPEWNLSQSLREVRKALDSRRRDIGAIVSHADRLSL